MRALLPLLVICALVAGCASPTPTPTPTPGPSPTPTPAPSPTPGSGPTPSPAATPGAPGSRTPATYVVNEYNISGSAALPSGLADITVQNTGKEIHQIQFLFIGNHTMDEFMAAVTSNATAEGAPLPSWATYAGGPNAVDPGAQGTATVDLKPGNYILACFVPAPDGKPHAAHGMIKFVSVGSPPIAPAAPPTADLEVSLREFAFTTRAAPSPGSHTIRVVNNGTEPHEAFLLRLDGNATVWDFINSFNPGATPPNPPPWSSLGGVAGLEPGGEGWFNQTFQPGHYAYLCFLGQPPHFVKGMISEFNVTAPGAI